MRRILMVKTNQEKVIEPIPVLRTLEDLATEVDTLFGREIGSLDPGAAVLISYRGEAILAKGIPVARASVSNATDSKVFMRSYS